MDSAKLFKRLGAFFLLLTLSATFFELGLWQLHRARASQAVAKPLPEKPVVDLATVASVGSNLRTTGFNRLVSFTATYKNSYIAPHQYANGAYKDLEVRLAVLSNDRAVLVVRGVNNMRPATSGEVRISGRLYPRQTEDMARAGVNELSRLDPALVTNIPGVKLFDGYVIATKEENSDGVIGGEYLPARAEIPKTAGFYWQHMAYVVTWWFMAILVWGFPFYGRFVRRDSEEKVEG